MAAFQPQIDEQLIIDGLLYHVAPQSVVMPGGSAVLTGSVEGQQSTVYKLVAGPSQHAGESKALKVFKPRYRLRSTALLSDALAAYAQLPGLQVCARTVLTPRRHGELLRRYFDLTYSVLMPWVTGPTWASVLRQKRSLTPEECLYLARRLSENLAAMERAGVAHCQLSGENVLLPILEDPGDNACPVAFVDVEQLCAPSLERPDSVQDAAPGYAHLVAQDNWSPLSDRFAGAVLLAEILGWHDEQVRQSAWGDSYFRPDEVQQRGERYDTLLAALNQHPGDGAARLFARAWESQLIDACPTYAEWLEVLPEVRSPFSVTSHHASQVTIPGQSARNGDPPAQQGATQSEEPATRALIDLALRLANEGNLAGAFVACRQAQELVQPASALAQEVLAVERELINRQQSLGSTAPIEPNQYGQSVGHVPIEALTQPLAQPYPILAEHLHPGTTRQDSGAPYGNTSAAFVQAPVTPVPFGVVAREKSRKLPLYLLVFMLLVLAVGGGASIWWLNQPGEIEPPLIVAVEPSPTPIIIITAAALTDTPYPVVTLTPTAPSNSTIAVPPVTFDAIVNTENLNLREGPGAEYGLASPSPYPRGAGVRVTGKSPDETWVKVNTLDNYTGWMAVKRLYLNIRLENVPYAEVPPSPTPQPPTATALPIPQLQGRIAFATNRDAEKTRASQILIADADGSNERQVTTDLISNLYPDWSPDGQMLVYIGAPHATDGSPTTGGDIYTIGSDGRSQERHTYGRYAKWPKWSPDGRYIVFADASDLHSELYDIYLLSLDYGTVEQLTYSAGFDGFPTWTRYQEIVFVSERDGGSQIYTMDINGNYLRQITYSAGEKSYPDVSPDGIRIAFTWQDGPGGRVTNIYTMDVNGSDVVAVTSDQHPARNLYPSWSPDGDWLAFHSNRHEPTPNKEDYEIYVVRANGEQIQRITDSPHWNDEPAWR